MRLRTAFLVLATVAAVAAGPPEPQAVFQRFAASNVPDEPFQWMVPRKEMLYMRHPDDYYREFVEARLEPVRTGNLFNVNSRTFFGIANSPSVGMISADGTITFEGVTGFAAQLFQVDPPCTITFQPNNPVNFKQYLEKNYLPFINTEWVYQGSSGVTYKTTVGGVSYNGRLLYVLRLAASPRRPDLAGSRDSRVPEDMPYRWGVMISGADVELTPDGALRSGAGVFGKAVGKISKVGQQLRSEGTTRTLPEQWIVVAAGQPLTQQDLAALQPATVKALFEKQQQDWETFLAQGTTLDMPLSMLGDAYRASLINMKIAQRKIGAGSEAYFVDVPGATMYKRFWWRDGGYIQHAWDAAGHHDEARRALRLATSASLPDEVNRLSANINVWLPYNEAIREFGNICRYQISQREDGSWTAPPGQWDSTGIALWALSSHYLMTRDSKWLDEAHPYMERGAQFLMRARVGTGTFRAWVEKYWPAYAAVQKCDGSSDEGLLPGGGGEGGSRTDFRLFYRPGAGPAELRQLAGGVPKQSYFHDFFAVRGLRSYAQVVKESARGDAAPYLKSADDLVRALEVSITRTMSKFGITWIPAGPDGDIKTALIGAVLYPCRVFPPHHPIVDGTIRYFRGNAKLHIAPEGFYGTHADRWSYTQANLGASYLQRGEPRYAQRLLDTFVRCMWLPGSWSENIREPHSRTVFGDQPHLWATAFYVLMLREFLLREEGGALLIADGMHPLWLPPGKRLSVKNAPTDFGAAIDYIFRRSDDGKRITLDVTARGPLPSEFTWTPRGFGTMVTARCNGKPCPVQGGAVRFGGVKNHVELLFR